ncbi:SpaA isopeptide-forming pilin-related protein [Carnobacterium maltaromaticum]|uniref:SpaA isopeptide-forming pilin-related protein n=1 Tax=Carnobacterium maltaromaticum TaxID=2751 RepID=A0AAW9K7C1_CARML|nr:SpaA isopeptide-forming pilin-related protein [Carnobacterium maltaromaticum]MDZ5759657.1 SpaA isopeptide-forming pilin-related protein [Carnobacterium maltaromaticum]
MKKFKLSKNMKKIVTSILVVGQVIVSSLVPMVANADVNFPKEITLEYNLDQLYSMSGTYSDGRVFSTHSLPLYANYDGIKQAMFCIEPGVPINNPSTPGYASNPLPDVANKPRAKFISVLWKYAGTDADTQMVAQAMLWKEVNGLTITDIDKPDGSPLSNYQAIKDKINVIVADYVKRPSFDGQKVKINLGESITLTDLDNVGLSRFDSLSPKSDANVDWAVNGNKLVITPKKDAKVDGFLRFIKSLDVGTPVAYKKAGQQTVMAGAIDDPNGYQINLEIVKTGEVKISKSDKGTGKVVPGTKFDVTFDGKTQSVTTDSKGEAIVKDIPHESKVKVTEKFVPAPYILDTNNTKEVVVKAGKTASVEFKNERATGKTTLTKQDATTKSKEALNPTYPLAGAKYGLFKKDGTLLKEFTLAADLTASMDKLELGSYYWAETLAPTGYTLDKTKHVVELTYKDQVTPVVVKDAASNEDVIRMNLDGQKLIQNDTNEIFKNGVEFTLTNKRTQETKVITTSTVDGKKGYFNYADLAIDDYVLTETKGVEGYKNVDPIEILHSYDKESDSFTFTVKDQKSGNVLNEETLTQLELSQGQNVDLGTYTLKDKAVVVEKPVVGISTQAHTGDGKTQTFIWGEELKAYDDVNLTHKNIPVGTDRAYETIQVAVYPDGTEKDVWSTEKVDYKVTDKETTERVLSEYDYKKDPKGTRYYFKEIGYNKPSEKEYVEDVETSFRRRIVLPPTVSVFMVHAPYTRRSGGESWN